MRRLIPLVLIISIHAYILTQLVFHPYQEFFTYPYFVNSGLLPYKQILDQHFPGLMFLPVNLATLGMGDEIAARLWLIGIVTLTHILLFFISRRMFKSVRLAILTNLLYLAWQPFFEGWVLWIDSFLPLILLPAMYFTYMADLKGKTRYLVCSGLLLGIGVVFKQVVVPVVAVVGIVLLFRIRNIKKVVVFGLSSIVFPLIMLVYFQKINVLSEFWYWTITYNLEVFSQYGRKYPTMASLARLLGVYGMSIFVLLHKDKREVLWILTFLLASLASGYARFDYVHFQPSLVFVTLASALGVSYLWKLNWGKFLVIFYVFTSVFILSQFYSSHLGNKVYFFDDQTISIADRIKDFTNPGDQIFIFGSVPSLYQMSETLPSSNLYIQQYSWFMMISEDDILQSITDKPPNLIVADRSVSVDGEKITDYSSKINKYIDENYHRIDQIGTTEFMIRNP